MNETYSHPPEPTENVSEPVWSYRGYQLKSSEFTTAMVHFFRAEISRANVWRQRLDTTTNWAVISTGASITYAFSQSGGHHAVILLNTFLITLFLFIEARRYRYYELWSSRIRLMETDFFAAMLVPPFGPSPDWAESLAENLLQPHFPISVWEAIGRRYRRNYLWIFLVLAVAWLARLALIPSQAVTFQVFLNRATLGGIPGSIVITVGVVYHLFWILVGLFTLRLHQASGEVFPRYIQGFGVEKASAETGSWQPWFRHVSKRRQLLAFIITDQAEQVSENILKGLMRGVTAVQGMGMYTHRSHSVLMCALTVTEVAHLKSLVYEKDSQAFVIVSPVQEILGKGFIPLEKKD